MKKIYQTPIANVTAVHTRQMMAQSLAKYNSGADTGVVLGRQQNGWDNIWDGEDDIE